MTDMEYSFAYVRMEGAAVHPDDTDAGLTDEQFLKQLQAHKDALGEYDVRQVWCSRPELLKLLE